MLPFWWQLALSPSGCAASQAVGQRYRQYCSRALTYGRAHSVRFQLAVRHTVADVLVLDKSCWCSESDPCS